MTRDEQARARFVEIALSCAAGWATTRAEAAEAGHPDRSPLTTHERRFESRFVRVRAGFPGPSTGPWNAAGLTAAMEDAGLVVPDPGTTARREAIALLDFVQRYGDGVVAPWIVPWMLQEGKIHPLDGAKPGDIIAWLQHPMPAGMRRVPPPYQEAAGWHEGSHVAVIVAVDDESITTVGWDEGPAPGRVMKRRLWRTLTCVACRHDASCKRCDGRGKHEHADTLLHRCDGGLYGVARPVAR